MHDPINDRASDRLPPPPGIPRFPRAFAAKWPPDDDAPAMRGGGSYSGGGPGDDGDFRKGRFKPAYVLIAFLAVIGGAAAIFFGVKNTS